MARRPIFGCLSYTRIGRKMSITFLLGDLFGTSGVTRSKARLGDDRASGVGAHYMHPSQTGVQSWQLAKALLVPRSLPSAAGPATLRAMPPASAASFAARQLPLRPARRVMQRKAQRRASRAVSRRLKGHCSVLAAVGLALCLCGCGRGSLEVRDLDTCRVLNQRAASDSLLARAYEAAAGNLGCPAQERPKPERRGLAAVASVLVGAETCHPQLAAAT